MQVIQTMASSKSLTITTSMSSSCHSNLFSILLAFFFIISSFHTAFASSNSTNAATLIKTYKEFIKDYCNSTTYPNVCYRSLSPYASVIKTRPLILTKSSIYLALKATSRASSSLKKLSKTKGLTLNETCVIKDCLENINDAFYEVKQSAKAIKDLNGTYTEKEKFQWSNIQTWMSAAITDDSTCTDEFDEKEVRASLEKKIKTSYTSAESLIREALALVNKYIGY